MYKANLIYSRDMMRTYEIHKESYTKLAKAISLLLEEFTKIDSDTALSLLPIRKGWSESEHEKYRKSLDNIQVQNHGIRNTLDKIASFLQSTKFPSITELSTQSAEDRCNGLIQRYTVIDSYRAAILLIEKPNSEDINATLKSVETLVEVAQKFNEQSKLENQAGFIKTFNRTPPTN